MGQLNKQPSIVRSPIFQTCQMMLDVLESFVSGYEDSTNGFGVGSDHHVRSRQVNTGSLTRGTKVSITTRYRLRPRHDFDTR
jgi:hypothetical protein